MYRLFEIKKETLFALMLIPFFVQISAEGKGVIAEPKLSVQSYRGVEPLEQIIFTTNEQQQDAFGAKWNVSLEQKPLLISGHKGIEYAATFQILEGNASSVGLHVNFKVSPWTRRGYLVMPGTAYDGNRFTTFTKQYPPKFEDPSLHRLDLPTHTSEIPGLKRDPQKKSFIELASRDMATPGIGIYNPETGKYAWALAEEHNQSGHLGLSFYEPIGKDHGILRISSPVLRQFRPTNSQVMTLPCT